MVKKGAHSTPEFYMKGHNNKLSFCALELLFRTYMHNDIRPGHKLRNNSGRGRFYKLVPLGLRTLIKSGARNWNGLGVEIA